jgi:O-antigen ligase
VAGGTALVSAIETQSRGPLTAFLIANLLILGYVFFRKAHTQGTIPRLLKRWVPICLIVLVIAGGAALLFQEQIEDATRDSRFMVMFDKSKLEEDDNYLGRVSLQTQALTSFQAHPFFGVGIGGRTPPVTDEFPHNILIEMASELGIVGLFLWAAAFVYTVYVTRFQPILLVMLVQAFGCALVSGDFGYNFEYIFISIAALAFVPKGERELEGAAVYDKGSLSYNGS